MIQVTNVSKSFGTQLLFENINFTLGKGEKIGLVGRNGAGKSTLLKILLKEESPDSGDVVIPKNYKIANLKQHLTFSKSTLVEECEESLPEESKHDTYKIEKMLMGLGFGLEDFSRSPLDFSGGYQIRLNLAKVLLQEPDALLLDEPTNYLDIVSMRWLKNFLRDFRGEVILITHDRGFMDEISTHTMGIWREKLVKVRGSTEKFYEQLAEEEDIFEKTRVNQERKRKDLEEFVNKFRAKARQASLAQSRMKMLEKMPELEALSDVQNLSFEFNHKECPGKTLMEVRDLSFGYDKTKPLFKNLSFSLQKGDKVGIIGKNGKGKSTLLNLLARDLSTDQGTIQTHPGLLIGHFGQTNIQRLHLDNTVEQEIASVDSTLSVQRVRNICGTVMFSGDNAKKPIKILSGGERARVLLGKILARPTNLLMLDEPSNHLDQESVESLIEELKVYPGAVMVVTHSESFLHEVATKLIVFRKEKAEFILDNYEDFLKKYGWEDEIGVKEKPKINKNDAKKIRAELIAERSKLLSPLRKEVQGLEDSIQKDEAQVQKGETELMEMTDSKKIQELSIKLGGLKKKVDQEFTRLLEISEKLETISRDFETRLKELEEN